MAVHKKHEVRPSADASAFVKTTADKKALVGKEEKSTETKSKEVKTEPVMVSDIVTETIEVIEETPAKSSSPTDPLSEFKEKMVEEELSVPDNTPKKNFMWPILFIFIITMLLLVGVFLYKQGANTNDKINVVTLTPTPTITPEPTKTIDLTKYEIEIQNGGGVSGEASRQKESLTAEGFAISSIGNADNSDYTETIIKAKKEVEKAFLDELKSVLEKTFTVGEIKTLPDSASSSVVVILGAKK